MGEITQPAALALKVSFRSKARDLRLTVTTCGEFATPLAVIVTWPTNEPKVKLDVSIPTFVLEGVLPDDAERVSHGTSAAAVQEIVPEPRLVIARFWAVGPGCPETAVKFIVPVLNDSVGGGNVTLSVTGIT